MPSKPKPKPKLKKFSKQRVFNKVARHLLKQNKRALDGDACSYRGDEGLVCAVGCLIPDKLYNPKIENITPLAAFNCVDEEGDQSTKNKKLLAGILKKSIGATLAPHFEFLHKLQNIHDLAEPNVWKDTLRKFAVANKLKIPAVLRD